jgi:hypothetical protein
MAFQLPPNYRFEVTCLASPPVYHIEAESLVWTGSPEAAAARTLCLGARVVSS